MQNGGVVFNYANWSARYPELSAWVTQPQAQMFFNEAQIYVDNTPCTLIPNCAPAYLLTTFLNMITAHIAALNAPLNGTPSSPLVGRINNATQGTVTVATENQYPPGTAQWYQQTKYGSAYWAGTAQFRSARYIPGPRNIPNPWGIFGNFR